AARSPTVTPWWSTDPRMPARRGWCCGPAERFTALRRCGCRLPPRQGGSRWPSVVDGQPTVAGDHAAGQVAALRCGDQAGERAVAVVPGVLRRVQRCVEQVGGVDHRSHHLAVLTGTELVRLGVEDAFTGELRVVGLG